MEEQLELKEIILAFNFKEWNPTLSQWNSLLSALNDKEEVDRISAFKRPTATGYLTGPNNDSAKSSLAGRLLMIIATHRLTNLPISSIQFKRESNGKPYLVNKISHTYLFNVSHDGDYTVLYAVTHCPSSYAIGVDVMKSEIPRHQKINDFFDSMKSCFTQKEWSSIRDSKVTPEIQASRFFKHWCLKESFVKAIGVGIQLDLQSAEFMIKEKDDNDLENEVQFTVYDELYFDTFTHFVLLPRVLPGHHIALCHYDPNPSESNITTSKRNNQYTIETVTADQLMNHISDVAK